MKLFPALLWCFEKLNFYENWSKRRLIYTLKETVDIDGKLQYSSFDLP